MFPIELFLNSTHGMPEKFLHLSKGSLGSSSFVRLFLEKTLHRAEGLAANVLGDATTRSNVCRCTVDSKKNAEWRRYTCEVEVKQTLYYYNYTYSIYIYNIYKYRIIHYPKL